AARRCDVDGGSFWRQTEGGLTVVAVDRPGTSIRVGDRAGPGRTAVGMAATSLRTVHVPDATHEPELPQDGPATRLAVPVVAEGRLLGVIGLGRKRPRAFTDRQIQLVEAFARQRAIAS